MQGAVNCEASLPIARCDETWRANVEPRTESQDKTLHTDKGAILPTHTFSRSHIWKKKK